MKKTITTPNRSIPFITSSLAKTSLLFFVVLFLFSCEEDVNTVGFKPDRNAFKVRYVEIELPSSVLLGHSVVTSNVFSSTSGTTPRLLVGSYQDSKFGKIQAESFIQFRPTSPTQVLPTDAAFESLTLYISLDYYTYGSREASTVSFQVHQVTDSLITEAKYYNNSITDYNSMVLGSVSKTIDPVSFDDIYTKNNDGDATNNVIDSLAIPINSSSFTTDLFNLAKASVATTTTNATTGVTTTTYSTTPEFSNFRKFRRIFKGLALKSDASNKIVGFNPSSGTGVSRSKMVLKYNYTDTKEKLADGTTPNPTYNQKITGKVEFSLYNDGSISYSKITADRAGSSLQSVDELYKPFYPDGDNRFISSGAPIITKFDISQFFAYTDTIKNLLINSAEITIDPDEANSYKMPDNLGFRILNTKNDFLKSSDTVSNLYSGQIVVDGDGYFMLGDATSSASSIKNFPLTQKDNVYSYSANFTRYLQTLYGFTDKSLRLQQYALIPLSPNMGKSVNRLVFSKNNLKLKLYYTTPVPAEKK